MGRKKHRRIVTGTDVARKTGSCRVRLAFRELFAEFDAPLVERVDAPDDTLDKDLVLVEGDQLAERLRRQFLEVYSVPMPAPRLYSNA